MFIVLTLPVLAVGLKQAATGVKRKKPKVDAQKKKCNATNVLCFVPWLLFMVFHLFVFKFGVASISFILKAMGVQQIHVFATDLAKIIFPLVFFLCVGALMGVIEGHFGPHPEDWAAVDCFYFSAITMTTVGYGDTVVFS